MAKTKEVKGKSKAKRKKIPVSKAITRRKTTAVGTRTVRKRAAKEVPARRASPKKAKPTAKATAKATPAEEAAQPGTATPMASQAAQPISPGERVAVTRYYIYVTRGGDIREFFWEAKDEEEARLLVSMWNNTPSQSDELYFLEPYEGDG